MPKRTGPTSSAARKQVTLSLNREEANDLVALARYYEKSMGVSRYFVRFASGPEMRARFRFVKLESDVLEQFARAIVERMHLTDADEGETDITPRALVAFWGRALSSLNSSRSRRKLSPEKLRVRTSVEVRLRTAVARLQQAAPGVLDDEIATRRTSEAQWMRERLDSVP